MLYAYFLGNLNGICHKWSNDKQSFVVCLRAPYFLINHAFGFVSTTVALDGSKPLIAKFTPIFVGEVNFIKLFNFVKLANSKCQGIASQFLEYCLRLRLLPGKKVLLGSIANEVACRGDFIN